MNGWMNLFICQQSKYKRSFASSISLGLHATVLLCRIDVARNLSWGHSAGFVKFCLGVQLRRQRRRCGGVRGGVSPSPLEEGSRDGAPPQNFF